MDLNNTYLVIKIILGILGVCGVIFAGLWKWVPRFKVIFVGKKTITLVNDDTGYTNYWHIGSQNGKPILQVDCKFMVTNITDHPVALAKAIWKGKIKGTVEYMKVSIKDLNSQYWGSYDIPPHTRTRVSVDFFIIPVKMPKKGDVITLSIGIIDQYGKKHWIKNVDFRSS